MTDARVAAIQASFARMSADPRRVAQNLLDRLAAQHLLDDRWDSALVQRKAKNLAGALALVVRNADLVDTITGVMSRAAVSPFLSGDSPAYHEAVRAELHAGLRDADPEAWSDELDADWLGIVNVVADSTFGPSPANAEAVRNAAAAS